MSAREERAARRRAEWSGEVVELGQRAGRLHASTSPLGRLSALIDLSERAWIASGRALPEPMPRSDWPSEIFESPPRG